MTAILASLLVFVAFRLLWPVFGGDRKPKPRCYLASDDDAALHAHYRKIEMRKVDELRHIREASRRRYEGITWPAICWEYRRRELAKYMPTMRDMIA